MNHTNAAEIDNLRAAAEGARNEAARARSDAATLRAEVDRLRAALRDVVRFADVIPPGIVDRAYPALGEE